MSIVDAVEEGPYAGARPSMSRRERERLLEQELDPTLSDDEQKLVTEDDTPVDNILSEKQMRLLTEALYASWSGPPPGPDGAPRSFVAYANVGLYLALNQPPLVPDVLVSLDVEHPEELDEKRDRVYFVWRFGKLPDLVVEIVSNKEGGELSTKRDRYTTIGIPYYVVFDPFHKLGSDTLLVFELVGGHYVRATASFLGPIGLGVTLWRGRFENIDREWLRFCDAKGVVLPTGVERATAEKKRAETAKRRAEAEKRRAEAEKQRAEAEKQRAETEKERADKLAAKLRALGIDPDDV